MIKYILLFAIVVAIFCLIVRKVRTINKKNINTSKVDFLINHQFNYVFGLPGSGKSTLLAAVAQCAYEQGIPCFSSFPIRHAYKFQGFTTGYPVGSIFLLDEIYDYVGSGTNRGIPEKEVTMFFKEFRHSKYTIWACSQEADDVARRVRGVVTQSYALKNRGNTTILMNAQITEVKNEDGEKFILKTPSPFIGFFTDMRLYRPDFYDDFDSYCRNSYKVFANFESW